MCNIDVTPRAMYYDGALAKCPKCNATLQYFTTVPAHGSTTTDAPCLVRHYSAPCSCSLTGYWLPAPEQLGTHS